MNIIMLISIGFVVFFSALAAYFDYKTTYIYDWITYPMIFIGLVLLPFKSEWYIGLISAIVVFLLFMPFYKYGKIGGGDIKYFIGLCLLVPVYKGFCFILLVFFCASVLAGLFFGIKFIVQFIQRKYFEQVGLTEFLVKLFSSIICGAFCTVILAFGYSIYFAIFVGILFFVCMFVLVFQKFFYLQFSYKVRVDNLLEDDIIDLECFGKKGTKLINKKLIEELKEKNIREVTVYRDLPVFAPFLFVGVILSLFIF